MRLRHPRFLRFAYRFASGSFFVFSPCIALSCAKDAVEYRSIVYVGFAVFAGPFVVEELRRTVALSMICYGMYFANLVAKVRAGYRTSTCLLEIVV